MPPGLTQAQVVNRALQQIAAQTGVTGTAPNFSGPNSAASQAAGILYTAAVQFLLRQQDYEFSRTVATLTPTEAVSPFGWQFAYLYPADCLRIRSVAPANWNQTDPQPVRWSVEEAIVGGVLTKVVLANLPTAQIVYTTSGATEDQWDAMFAESMVRYLASQIVMALAGRPDFSKEKLAEAGGIVASSGEKDS